MTYGEAHVKEQMSLALVDGVFIKTIQIKDKPEPMEKGDALRYYNIKIFKHWVNDYVYDERVSIKQIKELVSSFMFGHKDRYKKYEELL